MDKIKVIILGIGFVPVAMFFGPIGVIVAVCGTGILAGFEQLAKDSY